jgi:hypothetical protein
MLRSAAFAFCDDRSAILAVIRLLEFLSALQLRWSAVLLSSKSRLAVQRYFVGERTSRSTPDDLS